MDVRKLYQKYPCKQLASELEIVSRLALCQHWATTALGYFSRVYSFLKFNFLHMFIPQPPKKYFCNDLKKTKRNQFQPLGP